jgi:hypothetical protein
MSGLCDQTFLGREFLPLDPSPSVPIILPSMYDADGKSRNHDPAPRSSLTTSLNLEHALAPRPFLAPTPLIYRILI